MKARMILAFVLLTAVSLLAQTFRGTILGTVTDPSGAVVAGAKVTVKNLGTGLERTTETSSDGSYALPELPIGTYAVTVTQTGFQTFAATGVTVDVATERRVDAALKAGEVSITVQVSADELPLVETTSNDLGGVITQETVKDLPVNGRDYTKLIYLNPGVAGSPDQISDSPGSFGEFSMNGARGRSNNYLLDGTDMNDGFRNDPAINEAGVFGTPATVLPLDAVAEVHVISNFQPEYGRNAGGVVNIVTKSGTNSLHGSAAEYFRNDALDARNYFNIASQPKAPFHNNQYGASLGGPIVKDKTFFFFDYEGQREPVGVVTIATVPNTGSGPNGQLAPTDSSNPVIRALLARHPWPAPNLPNGQASIVSPSLNNLTSLIAKIDQSFNPSNLLTGRYFYGDSVQSFPLALTASGGQLPGFNTYTPTRVQLVSLSYVHTFGSNQFNEIRYGWNRFAEGFFPADRSFHPSSIGLCAASSTAGCPGSGVSDSGLPIVLVSGVAQLGASSSDPRHRVDTNNQFIDTFSWKINKHDVKIGFDFHRTSVNQGINGHWFRGRLKFTGKATGSAMGDFLAGDVDSGLQYSGNSARTTFENNYGLYLQDSFRVKPTVTINYGLRWDYAGVVGEKNHLLSNITSLAPSTGTGTFTLTQVGQPGLSGLYNPQYKNFAPRVSVAWDVWGKGRTVVRAGYGIFFDAFSQDMVMGHLPYPPFFDPGPAYNPVGPSPIISATAVTGPIVPGVPVYGTPSCASLECDTFAFDKNIKTPYMENYNLNIQQQLGSKMMVQLAYVGSQGHHLWRFFDINQPSAQTINLVDATVGFQDFGSAARPYGGYCTGNPYCSYYVLNENSTGKSNYNSFQGSFRITGWHGVTSILNYVWSKSMDNSSDGEDFEPNAAQPQDSTNPQAEYGPSNFDLPRRLSWIFAYDIPKMGGGMQKLKNGWGINSTLSVQTGQPFQFNYNCEDDFSGGGDCYDRPDIVAPVTQNNHNPYQFMTLSSFAIPCAVTAATGAASDCIIGTRHYGNERRNQFRGPNFRQFDFAIYKNTPLTERVSLQLRADIFNLPNHPNFANPFLPAFLADPAFNGLALSPSRTREVGQGFYPITATGDVGIGNPFLGGGGPRGIQLAAKITF